MIDHLSTYATDFTATRDFYIKVFKPLGYTLVTEFVADWETDFPTRRICAFGTDGKASYWIIETREPATPRHVAFSAHSHNAVDAFHQQALASGSSSIGAPGPRPQYHENYYGAFVHDPDGNNVEAVCHLEQPADRATRATPGKTDL